MHALLPLMLLLLMLHALLLLLLLLLLLSRLVPVLERPRSLRQQAPVHREVQ
jgi:hypothetical protein